MGDLLLVAGDSSADNYAAWLVKNLKNRGRFSGEIFAAAGPRTAEAGAELVENLVDNAVVGFLEVLTSLPYFFSVASRLEQLIEEEKIETVLFMDFPGFNMRFARRLDDYDLNLMYYITPQVWAWGSRRLRALRKRFDELLVIFPFEKRYLADRGINARFVGHPLLETWPDNSSEEVREKLQLTDEKNIVSFFPGSRSREISRHLPVMAAAITKIAQNFPGWQPVLSRASSIGESEYKKHLDDCDCEVPIWTGDSRPLLEESEFAVLGSGTVTMEAAFATTPMLVGYRTSWVSYYIGRMLVDIDRIAMPNLVDRRVRVPELIQSDFNSQSLFEKTGEFLQSAEKRRNQRGRLQLLRSQFEGKNPTEEVAGVVEEYMVSTG